MLRRTVLSKLFLLVLGDFDRYVYADTAFLIAQSDSIQPSQQMFLLRTSQNQVPEGSFSKVRLAGP
jgi:hypothetical protein